MIKKINFDFTIDNGKRGYLLNCLLGIRYLLNSLKSKMDGDNAEILEKEIADYTTIIDYVKSLYFSELNS